MKLWKEMILAVLLKFACETLKFTGYGLSTSNAFRPVSMSRWIKSYEINRKTVEGVEPREGVKILHTNIGNCSFIHKLDVHISY